MLSGTGVFAEFPQEWTEKITSIFGAIFIFCIVLQVIFLEEWYLATVQFLLFSIGQLLLGSIGLLQKKV
ncbi:hypothetical protein F9U64_17955 [Gracilibacillus oryzae]|uniref:Uncharacterized protein n=1 Tax=Gracilibacillus oryzae TaxID=1672701 RepID=A0A7C8KS60_9BACI|nr:hypothetical protein [Gracilibacillus oryzae]KAB8127395.1 hypothetical protein F9U64_17955 [Gracilibacillus oryzae]